MTPDHQNTCLSFDTQRYPFHQLIASFIDAGPLVELRAGLAPEGAGEGTSLYRNMEEAEAFRAMYDALASKEGTHFYDLYHTFLREVVQPQYGEPIYFQRRPSHRILFRDTPGQSRYHRDSDYGHSPTEVNYFVPQTPTFATNAMWLESESDKGDFAPVGLSVGQYLRFDGANCRHGAHQNDTDASRVSFDFRVVPSSIAPSDVRESAQRNATSSGNPIMDNARSFALLS